jgi:hypothetical protein
MHRRATHSGTQGLAGCCLQMKIPVVMRTGYWVEFRFNV